MPNARASRKRRSLSLGLEKAGKQVEIWGSLSAQVMRSRRRMPVINLDRLNRMTAKGETVAIPGKVLGGGRIDHPVTVAAMHFSLASAKAIEGAGGKVLSLTELAKMRPDGKGVRLIV